MCGCVCVQTPRQPRVRDKRDLCMCQKRPVYVSKETYVSNYITHEKEPNVSSSTCKSHIFQKRPVMCIVYICANAPTLTLKRPKRRAYVLKQTYVSNYITYVKETYASSSTCKSHICQNRPMMCSRLNLCNRPDNHVQESKELLKIVGLVCKRAIQKRLYSAYSLYKREFKSVRTSRQPRARVQRVLCMWQNRPIHATILHM